MNHLFCRRIPAFILFLLFLFVSGWTQGDNLSEQEKIETLLQQGSIQEVIKNLEGGRTEYWEVILLFEGKECKARFKYIDRRRPRFIPDSYMYELAAYELNKLLEQQIVPPLVQRRIEEMEGSLQIFVPGCVTEVYRSRKNIDPPPGNNFDRKLADIKVFEYLTGEPCYDAEDILVDCEKWDVWRVDFSEAFSDSSSLENDCPIERCSRTFFFRLKSLDKNSIRQVLEPYLIPVEIDALLKRKAKILSILEQRIAEFGEDNVLF